MKAVPQIDDHLAAWQLTRPACRPIAHTVQSSMTWLVEAAEGRFVAKLVFDRPRFVEPGLGVAAAVAAAGIPTGAPLPTRSGDLCLPVTTSAKRGATLALLEYVDGRRLSPDAPDAARIAGGLLGRVHSFLGRQSRRRWVPAELLAWSARFAVDTGRHQVAALGAEIAGLARSGHLTISVIYGDPAPEIILTGNHPALIDWGTPSWGPQLHDVAAWLRWLGTAAEKERGGQFLAAYRDHGSLPGGEFIHLPLFRRYVDALFA